MKLISKRIFLFLCGLILTFSVINDTVHAATSEFDAAALTSESFDETQASPEVTQSDDQSTSEITLKKKKERKKKDSTIKTALKAGGILAILAGLGYTIKSYGASTPDQKTRNKETPNKEDDENSDEDDQKQDEESDDQPDIKDIEPLPFSIKGDKVIEYLLKNPKVDVKGALYGIYKMLKADPRLLAVKVFDKGGNMFVIGPVWSLGVFENFKPLFCTLGNFDSEIEYRSLGEYSRTVSTITEFQKKYIKRTSYTEFIKEHGESIKKLKLEK